MKRFVFFALIVGLVFVGCDTDNGNNSGNGDEFVSSNNDTISNDIVSLGLVGTSVSSNNSNVAIAEITTSAKIKIISVSEGSAVLTVSDASNNNATINISVSKTGSITIGTIVKWTPIMTSPFEGSWKGWGGDGSLEKIWLFTENNFIIILGGINYAKGTFSYTSTEITATLTHMWDGTGWLSEWTEDFGPTPYIMTSNYTISGNNLNLELDGDFVKQ